MEGATTARPAGWWWGTNQPGGILYAGRVHVVAPGGAAQGLCGLPVDDVWEQRPPLPDFLCPDCCVRAMAASYPQVSNPTRQPTGTAWRCTSPGPPVEQTVVLRALREDDDP
jgi:hypothetical protein